MKLFSRALLDELAAKATASPRQRVNHNVHASSADPVQRFFVAANRSTYFRPHRHLSKSELAIVIRGGFDVVTFDDGGTVTARYSVGEESASVGFETPSATWHTLVAQVDGAVFFEVKEGPYDPATAVEFAPWAPPEGHATAPAFLEWTRTANTGSTPAALGPTASGPAASSPTASDPATSGPTASGPTASSRTASGPAASSPTASDPATSGPTASGPTASGPTASGPATSSPIASGRTASGPTASGPTASGPTAPGPAAPGSTLPGPTTTGH